MIVAVSPVRAYGVISLPESVEAIVWPIPAGCPAGAPEWSAISDPATVAVDGTGLAVQPGLVFFSSTSALYTNRCAAVASAADVWAVVNTMLDVSYAASTQLPALDQLNTSGWIMCPDDNLTQACVDVRAGLVTLNTVPANAPGRFRSFVNGAVQLQSGCGDADRRARVGRRAVHEPCLTVCSCMLWGVLTWVSLALAFETRSPHRQLQSDRKPAGQWLGGVV